MSEAVLGPQLIVDDAKLRMALSEPVQVDGVQVDTIQRYALRRPARLPGRVAPRSPPPPLDAATKETRRRCSRAAEASMKIAGTRGTSSPHSARSDPGARRPAAPLLIPSIFGSVLMVSESVARSGKRHRAATAGAPRVFSSGKAYGSNEDSGHDVRVWGVPVYTQLRKNLNASHIS
jgi:hypothetical protein